jgi:ribosomal protein L31
MTGLTAGQRVIVTIKGRPHRGEILEVYFRSYKIRLDSGAVDRFSASKVRPENGRKPTALLSAPPISPDHPGFTVRLFLEQPPRPIPKPSLPEECPAWLAFVRKLPCCNCGSRFRMEAHHEGKKDAFAQKVRDTLAVGLCLECHTVYTAKNRLPTRTKPDGIYGDADLRTRAESLRILRFEQERLLRLVLSQLDQQDRIDLLSKGIATLSKPGALSALLGRVEAA